MVPLLKWNPILLAPVRHYGTLHVCSTVCMCVSFELYDLPTKKKNEENQKLKNVFSAFVMLMKNRNTSIYFLVILVISPY